MVSNGLEGNVCFKEWRDRERGKERERGRLILNFEKQIAEVTQQIREHLWRM